MNLLLISFCAICGCTRVLYGYNCSSISNSQCVVTCNDSFSCKNLSIDVSQIFAIDKVRLECNGYFACQHLLYQHSSLHNATINILCNGAKSCFSSRLYSANNHSSISLYCRAMDSCIDTEIETTPTTSSDVSIHFIQSCSSTMSIVCFNEMTKCYISCLNQNIQISSNGFTPNWFTLITES
eukprot:906956_1